MLYTPSIYRLFACVLVSACLFIAVPAAAQQGGDLTDEQVGQAIEKIKKFLFDAQDKNTGGWYGSYHESPKPNEGAHARDDWGPSAMALLALIVSGESPQHPDIARGLELIAKAEFHGVYALSMRAHVWSYLPQGTFGKLLRDDKDRMLESSNGPSRFNYWLYGAERFPGQIRIDNSTTQYGILCLWQASKRGHKIPKGFWEDAVDNFLKQQSNDGGWAYTGNRATTQSMTLAGLTVLYVAQQELFRGNANANAKITASINKGLAYLDKNFSVKPQARVHGGVSYMWYGYERVGLASGRKYFGGKDWFQEIAKQIIAKNGKYGSSIHNAAFDLMFLSRGRVPVWINKLEIPGYSWNNRPNDIYFLNRYVSEYREHEVNWQTINIDTSSAEDWMSAPLLWISGDESLAFNDAQVEKIKRYLDLGGTLVVNPEKRSTGFRASVQDLAEKMYPDLAFEPMDKRHPMATLLEGDPRGARQPDIDVLSNGARVLIVMPRDDWGVTFQGDDKPDPKKTQAWKYIINIYGVATDRGQLTPRLTSPIIKREQRAATGTIKVVVPRWEDPAGRLPEADVYAAMKNYMFNETGKQLDVQYVPLSELAGAGPALLHLAGVDAVEIKPGERQAILDYMNSGGTVLIETIGGTGKFAESVNSQLAAAMPGSMEKVSTRSDIITGRNLPDGSKNNRKLIYRRLVLERANPDALLLMRGYSAGDRMPVLVSFEDLSLGMLGVKQYGINGYSPKTARNLMINILLEAEKAKNGG